MTKNVINHYDLLIEEGNDPVLDPPILQAYMDKWDGQLFIDLLNANKSKSALEIGCGTGRLAIKIAPLVNAFCGIDISPRTINVAKTHLHFENTTLICGDFLEYDFAEKFDIIYSSLTFLHIQDKEKAIQTVAKYLNDNGKFVLSLDKNQNNNLEYGTHSITTYPDNPKTIISLLKISGFKNIEQYESEFAYIIAAQI